ncbi:elongation factor 1-delta isoform X2 [Calliopsis andreniformis]|uniref:elongation factor 1-delta isoform X2 n=1 Tax=Calliopsis andreniformis TaxID=337506 RepID=UPI003FCDC35C
MEKSALAQEKVWFDKPSYDKAERLYFEKMARVVSQKIMESCPVKSEVSVTNNCPDILNNSLSKSKSEKSKDNKLLISENAPNDILKNSKCQVKASKTVKEENEYNKEKEECVEEKQRSENIKNDIKEKETSPSNDASKKYNTKEVKEKKNKADTRHRNKGKRKNEKEVKENANNAPLIRNKQQLPNQWWIQGNQQTTTPILSAGGSLANEVAKARQHIKQSLQCMDDIAVVAGLTPPNDNKKDSVDVIDELRNIIANLEKRVEALELKVNQIPAEKSEPAPKQKVEKSEKAEDDDDVDLFGSDSEGVKMFKTMRYLRDIVHQIFPKYSIQLYFSILHEFSTKLYFTTTEL